MTLTELYQFLGMGGGVPPPVPGAAIPGAAYRTPEQIQASLGIAAPPVPPMPLPEAPPVAEAPPTQQEITSYAPMETPAAATRPPLPEGLSADQFFSDFAAKWDPEREVNPMNELMNRLGGKIPQNTTARPEVRGTPQFGGLGASLGGAGQSIAGGLGAKSARKMLMPAPSRGERLMRSSPRGYNRPAERMNWMRGLQSQRGF